MVSSSSSTSPSSMSATTQGSKGNGSTHSRNIFARIFFARSTYLLTCGIIILGWFYLLFHGVDTPWWYSKLTGSYPPPHHNMSGFYKFTLCHLINISSLILLWWHPIAKRVLMAFNYCFVCLTLMSVSSNIGWFRNPNHMGHVPDFVHELIGFTLETISVPGSHYFTHDHQSYQLNAIHIAEYIMLGLMYTTIAWALTQPWRWLALRRWFTIQGTLALLRSITVLVTNVPDSRPYCHVETPGTTPYHELPWPQIWERTFQLATMGDMVTCGDMVYSGHTMLLVLCGMAWHSYYKVIGGIFTVNIVKFFIWILILFALFLIIATRLHYTLDVLLALYLTITIWGAYHRAADDVFVGHRYIAVYIIDGLLLYPAISWLEAPELGEAADSGMVTKYPRSSGTARFGNGRQIQWAAQVAAQYFSEILSRDDLHKHSLPRINLTSQYDKLSGIDEVATETGNNAEVLLPEFQLPGAAIHSSTDNKLYRARSESEAIAASEFLNDLLSALSANADILATAANTTANARTSIGGSKLSETIKTDPRNVSSSTVSGSVVSPKLSSSSLSSTTLPTNTTRSIRSPVFNVDRNHHRTPSPLVTSSVHKLSTASPNTVGRSPSRPSDADIATAANIMRRLSAGLGKEIHTSSSITDNHDDLGDVTTLDDSVPPVGYNESRSGLAVRDISAVAKSVVEWVRNVTSGSTPQKNSDKGKNNPLTSPTSSVSSSTISSPREGGEIVSPDSKPNRNKKKQ